MAQTTEGASEAVEKVRFSFMTDGEVRRHSVVKITNPVLLDSVDRPSPGGLYDPAMGPLDEHSPCKSCGQRSFHCPGHCGHIDLVSPAYNPLLFDMLYNLLQNTCFYCFHFRARREEVSNCVSQLELIAKGDVIGARRLDTFLTEKQKERWEAAFVKDKKKGTSDAAPVKDKKKRDTTSKADLTGHEDSERSHVSCGTTVYCGTEDCLEINKRAWDSFQFTEAMSVLNKFLRPKRRDCSNCEAKNPKIKKSTFGWFHMEDMGNIRANIIKGRKFGDQYSSVVDNATSSSWENDLNTSETDSFTAVSDGIKDSIAKDPLHKGVLLAFEKHKSLFSGPLLPYEVSDVVKRLWKNEALLCSLICDIQREQLNMSSKTAGDSMFFLGSILVPPLKFRPAAKGGDAVMEHAHTLLLGRVLQSNIALGNACVNNAESSRIVNRWMDLQQSINVLYDSKTMMSQGKKDGTSGICQLLEKKEGIFRQKMMGKRVNFACRSVISPDPYLAVNEIGIPPYFALRLTYPERVTPWNVGKLRDAIVNGPEVHPGAISYADKVSTVKLPSSKKMRIAISRKLPSSRGMVTQSGKNSEYEFEGKTVYRHLQDGDIVLVNRQPTLHKPSIMAHVVRVLKGEKTLRMHYANCSTYNADFDGDEMNVHFPQDEISRAEAYSIVNANEQYIVPTKGDTVRALIQDHIVSAVLLTLKDTFLTLDEFNQLLYGSGVFAMVSGSFSANQSKKISTIDSEGIVKHVLPAVWKPKPLWTGKQVITALLNHLTRGCEPFSLEKEMKIPEKYFHRESKKVQLSKDEKNPSNQQIKDEMKNSENSLVVWKNELVQGVIDKAQFGQFGLVHTVQELYGSNSAGLLLSALSRLFTIYLQLHGFTCGVDDLIILPDKDMRRKELLDLDAGKEVHSKLVHRDPEIAPMELQLELEKVIGRNRESATTSLDLKMRKKFKDQQEKISKDLLLTELLKPFPKNCISLMTISGAKGGTVNFQQISSFLGQQDLEGKRVPRMVSGKTLPCFPPWDFTSRAGGYITDRFLSGLRPQEYYFHCMAGREGLVDTAVKTSRSGYLQRCLIKNLESLKVCYDYSVRDADGSIVQFKYGEDGVDVHQTSFLKNFEALVDNQETLQQKFQFEHEFNAYIDKLPEGLEEDAEFFLKNLKNSESEELLKFSKNSKIVNRADFLKFVNQKYLSSLAPSGEPVGVIAAQSIGEPSTQMTLNTFHLAGRGEMNVTLGIPRLQEILMTASDVIKTPVLTCPFLHLKSKDDANSLLAKVKMITVADIIENMEVHLLPFSVHHMGRIYKLLITFKLPDFISLEEFEETLKEAYLEELEDAIYNHIILLRNISGIMASERHKMRETDEDASGSTSHGGEKDDDGDDEGDDERAEDLGSDLQKRKQQTTDEMDYEDGSEDDPGQESAATEVEKGKGNQSHDESGTTEDEELKDADDASKMLYKNGEITQPKSTHKRTKQMVRKKKKFRRKKTREDRRVFVADKGLNFEVHFRLDSYEPHLLLAQIAQKAAKEVYIEGFGKISECRMVEYDPTEKTVRWDQKKAKVHSDMKTQPADNREHPRYWALKAAGVDFDAFWEMGDDLDVTRIYSNNIHAMLKTYGVEAARRTIITEVTNVFEAYGVKVDYRHLSLIADYMTHTGGYRPMSRHGSIAESLSPLAKMSFETASKFIVEAASHGMTDDLETPSSRISLGLPVKMGTGSFDLMQNLEFE